MHRYVNLEKLEEFMTQVGRRATTPGTLYVTGGSSALLLGIRDQTIDIDIKLDPEPGGVFEAIAELKILLSINVELASPDLFIPELPGWRDRSHWITTAGMVTFRHYDFYGQALSKIERGYRQDLSDATALIQQGLIDKPELVRLSEAIRLELIRYPGIEPTMFYAKIEAFLVSKENDESN